MSVVFRDILVGMAQDAADSQLVHAGHLHPGGGGVPAPVGRGLGDAQRRSHLGEQLAVTVSVELFPVLVADDGIALSGQPGGQVGTDLRVDRDDPVPAGIGLEPALEITALLRVVGGAGQPQELGDAEAGVAQHEDRIRPRKTLLGQLLQMLHLEVAEGAPLLLDPHVGHLNESGVVLDYDIPLHGVLEECFH